MLKYCQHVSKLAWLHRCGIVMTYELQKGDQKVASFVAILAGMSENEHLWYRPPALLHAASSKDKGAAAWPGHPGVCGARGLTAECILVALE